MPGKFSPRRESRGGRAAEIAPRFHAALLRRWGRRGPRRRADFVSPATSWPAPDQFCRGAERRLLQSLVRASATKFASHGREWATGCPGWTLSARRNGAGFADHVARRAVKAPHGSMPPSGGAGVPRDIPASRSPRHSRELRRLREPYPFWKKRKRFTADGPREKKSPDLSGCEQSSSEAPSMSGLGSSSPLTYVPQVERRSTIE
jgi:hypothetical protein